MERTTVSEYMGATIGSAGVTTVKAKAALCASSVVLLSESPKIGCQGNVRATRGIRWGDARVCTGNARPLFAMRILRMIRVPPREST